MMMMMMDETSQKKEKRRHKKQSKFNYSENPSCHEHQANVCRNLWRSNLLFAGPTVRKSLSFIRDARA